MMKRISISSAALVLALCTAWALPVPQRSSGGVTLRIENLDPLPPVNSSRNDRANLGAPEIDAGKPLALSFTLSNGTARSVSGTFRARMNDDWTLEPPGEETVSLSPGETKRISRLAKAGPRILPALYPVHAEFTSAAGIDLHPVAVFRARTDNRAFSPPKRKIPESGAYRIGKTQRRFAYVTVNGVERKLDDPEKADPKSHGAMRWNKNCWCANERKEGYYGHPPFEGGVGEVASAWGLDIPATDSVRLKFSVGVPHGKSDGVGVRVLAGTVKEKPVEVFSRHVSETGKWQDFTADLTRFAGRRIVLRLAIDAGPEKVPHFDGFVVSEPVLVTGAPPPPPAAPAEVAAKALANASRGQYRLECRGETYFAGVAEGARGLIDGAVAFKCGDKSLVFNGFECLVDGLPAEDTAAAGKIANRVWAEKGTLKIAWEMPGVKRGRDGSPRFTRIAAGPADSDFTRVYLGTGNVVENPRKFTATCGGFTCSTRHVGADYANGLSLVQASDIFPDEVVCDASERRFALATHNDAVISFTPSAKGAFAAAVDFAAVSGYRRSPGFGNLADKMVLDDWRGNYRRAAEELRQMSEYGIKAVYIQHNWQRWGYDVRLPEIWPPRGDRRAFDAMADAAHKAGFPIGLHDNYIDIYPDVPGFSYDSVYFHEDGTPHEAWYNPGPRLLSYKWHPDRIWKWHNTNMKAMADHVGAGALFIDVFTASAPRDFYDREGRFRTKNEQAAGWAAAFDRARTIFGKPDAIMVSEAGHDALIGHVDAGEADHFPVRRVLGNKAGESDGERVPWHDAVSHGKMILLGGGLGFRYSGVDLKLPGADDELHGYASHDYLCTTAIGGRGTMCALGDARKAVLTWWLLGDIQKRLAEGSFDAFEFGRDIHEQHSVFSTGEVWVNRATNRCWTVGDHVLPPYGLYAKAGDSEAGIVRKDGYDVRFAKSPGKIFVDARPPAAKGVKTYASAEISGFEAKGKRDGELKVNWNVSDARAGEYRVFVHAEKLGGEDGKIVFQGSCVFAGGEDALSRPGRHESVIRLRPWASVPAGEYDIRFGLFHRKTGERTALYGWDDGNFRIFGGILTVAEDGELAWRRAEGTRRTRELGINSAQRKIDFGGVVTDGAFLLEAEGGEIVLTPMPGSLGFSAWIDPRELGLEGDIIDFKCDGRAGKYRLKGK